jgi:hypothetical protein
MISFPPVPKTVSKSVQVGSFSVFLYCTAYDFPFSVGKDRLRIPWAIIGALMAGTIDGPIRPRQLAAAVTVRD